MSDRSIYRQPDPMSEEDLLRILQEEDTDASAYYASDLARDQANALDRYHAQPYGDELDDRSKVVTHDIEDTVNWLMPALLRTFTDADDLITCDDAALDDDDETLTTAADYLHHILFKDNDGATVIHDFAFDALVQRIGVVRVAWEDPEPSPPMRIDGVTLDQLVKYANDPEYEILAVAEDGDAPTEPDDADDMSGDEAAGEPIDGGHPMPGPMQG